MAYPKVVQQVVHELVAERLAALAHGARDVADQADGHGAETRLLLVAQSVVEEGRKRLHVLDKVSLHGVRQTANRGKGQIGRAHV